MLQMYLVGHASFHRVRTETVGMVYTGGEEGKEEDKEGEAGGVDTRRKSWWR